MKLYSIFLVLSFSLLVHSLANAQDKQIYINTEWGTGHVNLDDSHTTEEFDADGDLLQGAVQAGGILKEWVLLAHYSWAGADEGLFGGDHFELRETGLLAGYQFNLGGAMRLTPSVGYNYWELDVDENSWFDGEGPYKDTTGYAPNLKLTFGFDFGRVVGFNFSYGYSHFEFGKSETFRAGIDFHIL